MNKRESYWCELQYASPEVDYTEELKKEINATYEKYVTVR